MKKAHATDDQKLRMSLTNGFVPAAVASHRNAPRYVSLVAAGYAFIGGLVSLAGWIIGNDALRDWWHTGITIKANTAIGFIAAGGALLIAILLPTARRSIYGLAGFSLIIGTLTLLEHIVGANFGIDTLFFDEAAGAPATSAPGRMGPPASVSFLAIGIATILMTGNARSRSISVYLALLILCIGTLSCVGYIYGAEAMYRLPRLTGVSIQSATMIVALGVGMLAALPDRQPTKTLCEIGPIGDLARRLVPAAIAVPLVLGWLRLVGHQAGFYDHAFGTALRTLAEMVVLSGVVWWTVQTIRSRDRRQRLLEAERIASDQRLASVLNSSAVGFMILRPVKDSAGSIIDFSCEYLNPAARKTVFESNPDDQFQNATLDSLPEKWRQSSLMEELLPVAAQNDVRDFELQCVDDGEEEWWHIVASPLQNEVAVWFADISQRKLQEQELRSADRRKDEFLATLAHELRNPLAPIRQAAILANKPTVSEAQRQWSNGVIERQVQHMSVLLEDLLDVSRITRGTLELRRESVLLTAVIDSAVETARPAIDNKKHTLTLDLPTEPVHIDVDPVRISQVIANLLNNAAKFTQPGGHLSLSASAAQGALVLKISDNGIGLSREDLTAVFKMFSQIKSAHERTDGGLGIGLALARGLVELHRGTVTAESPGLGAGTTFTIRIPDVCFPIRKKSSSLESATKPTRRGRILVADDNRDAADSLAMLLRADNNEVMVAYDGTEALAAFHAFLPDVVLLDIGMPGMTGHAVAERIRATDHEVLLVAITGWGQVNDRSKSKVAGFDHHLTKPVDYSVLSDLIAAHAVSRVLRQAV
jgi:signal transduction histidine kinase/CheY-like chemotaxis protein